MRKLFKQPTQSRKGAIIPFSVVSLTGLFMFVSFSVDLGLISLTRARMQNAVDSASLAAAQEITLTIREIGESYSGGDDLDVNAVSEANARAKAIEVAAANDVFVAPEDVEFGKRVQDASGNYSIAWGVAPYNVVRVQARMDNDDLSAPDAKLPLAFAQVFGEPTKEVYASAAAFVEARDIGLILDFSASMNDDSEISAYSRLPINEVIANQQEIFDALEMDTGNLTFDSHYIREEGRDPQAGNEAKIYVTYKGEEVYVESSKDLSNIVMVFENGNHQKIEGLSSQTGTFKGSGGNNGRVIKRVYVKSGAFTSGEGPGYGERFELTVNEAMNHFGLNGLDWPFDGGSWNEYVRYVMFEYKPYGGELDNWNMTYNFGGQTLVQYLIRTRPEFFNNHKHWKTPAQPITALKNGVKLFCDYLGDLQFSDHVGVVSYCDDSYLETVLNHPSFDVNVDISNDPITSDYDAIYQIVRHKQAGHYTRNTGMGFGVNKGINLIENYSRVGTKPTIVLMTDGLANRSPGGFSLPGNWDWSKLTDYDQDGVADYTTNDRHKSYSFYEVKRAIDRGYTVHTITVGGNADNSLMEAIAFAGGGVWVDVPGGATIAEMETQMLEAFAQIAAHVPPPKLIDDLR